MIIRTIKTLIATLLMATAVFTHAGEPVSDAIAKQIRGALEPAVRMPVSSVEKSEVPGLNSVTFENGATVYATDSGEFFIVGDVHQVKAGSYLDRPYRLLGCHWSHGDHELR